MTRMIAPLAALAVVVLTVEATAQGIYSQPTHGHRHLQDHDYWHHDFHTPDVAQLDSYADQLAKIARHLHADAHKLSQDYEHSQSIERYVDNVDRLQQHMHEILHEAAESGYQSSALTRHIKSDVRQVKSLLSRLYGELQHQGFDGARTADFHAMAHMRRIIVEEAFPLVHRTEVALYGYSLAGHPTQYHRRPTSWLQPTELYRR